MRHRTRIYFERGHGCDSRRAVSAILAEGHG